MRRTATRGEERSPYDVCLALLLVPVFALVCASCSSTPKIGAESREQVWFGASTVFFVVRPSVVVTGMRNETLVDTPKLDSNAIEAHVAQLAKAAIRGRGFQLAQDDTAEQNMISPEEVSRSIVRSPDSDPARRFLEETNAGRPGELPVFITVEVLVGPRGYYDVFYGLAGPTINRTVVKAEIVNPRTKGVVWESTAQLRDLPRIESKTLRQLITLVFSSLGKGKE